MTATTFARTRAMLAVAHHLGTTPGAERARRDNEEAGALRFTWWCHEGGDHIVRAGVRFFAVDLVCDTVMLRVGTMPKKEVHP
jgi:hypothetical protein